MSENQISALSKKLNIISVVLTILTMANIGTLVRDHFTLEQVVKTLAIDHPRVEEMWWTSRPSKRGDPGAMLPTDIMRVTMPNDTTLVYPPGFIPLAQIDPQLTPHNQ